MESLRSTNVSFINFTICHTIKFLDFSYKVQILTRNGPFICDRCGSKLPTRQSFNAHFRLIHHKVDVRYCDLCPQSFGQKYFLNCHMERVHLKLCPFKCSFCKYKGPSNECLKQHMLRHGPKTECKVCHKLVTNIKNHLRIHFPTVKCPKCMIIVSQKFFSTHIRLYCKKN